MIFGMYILFKENTKNKIVKDLIKSEYLINTGAAFMGARDWDGETSLN